MGGYASKIGAREASIKSKEDTISQLNMQIRTDQIQIKAFQQMIDELCAWKGETQ